MVWGAPMNSPWETREESLIRWDGAGTENLATTGANILPEQTIKEYVPASWFHPVGVFKVLARIWDRLPDVSGTLFLTFTLDPKNYANEETAFEHSWMTKRWTRLPSRPGLC